MGIEVLFRPRCDLCHTLYEQPNAEKAMLLRDLMKEAGWKRHGGEKVICPECAKCVAQVDAASKVGSGSEDRPRPRRRP